MIEKGKQVKLLDCTIRDGGLVNNWDFSVEFVREVYQALSAAGVDYMEVGYKNSPKLVKAPNAGPWAFLDENLLREAIGQKTDTKISAVVDIGRVDEADILPRSESLIDLIRITCYIQDVEKAMELESKFGRMGYETSINIMAVSTAKEDELNAALEKLSRSSVDIVYVVDSFGSLMNKDIESLVAKFRQYLPNKQLGIHTHNNMQMAFSNTLTGAQNGITYLDSSVYGMGRAAGNCPTELIVGHLKNEKYDVRPILDIIERLFIPMRREVEWGYTIPYAIAGLLNEHPRAAIALRSSDDRDKYTEFYDKLTAVEALSSRV